MRVVNLSVVALADLGFNDVFRLLGSGHWTGDQRSGVCTRVLDGLEQRRFCGSCN